jgi:biopolymer transport protein ExbD
VWSPSRAAKERIAKRGVRKRAGIDYWPTLGVAILMLIIVMLVEGSTPHHGVYADLALTKEAVRQPKAVREDAMRVTVTRDGSVYFRNAKIDPSDLPHLIRQAVKEGAERKVYLIVDSRGKYRDAKVVYDLIAEGGVREICLIAEKIVLH